MMAYTHPIVVGMLGPVWDLVILTTNLSYGERMCLGVGVVTVAAAAADDEEEDSVSGLVVRLLLLACAINACLLTATALDARLPSIPHSVADVVIIRLGP